MKKIYEIVEKLNFGGQDREFFDIHEEEIREHNIKLSKALIIVLGAIDGIYAVTGMNSQSNPQIRMAYILFLVFLMVFLALFEVIEKKSQNGYVIIFTIIEMAFVFLLFAEPVLDRTPIACFIPAFFAIAFVLPLIPIHWMAEIFALDLVVFFAVTLVCKEYSVAITDVINSSTCYIMGIMLGGYILVGRCTGILARDVLKETSDAEVARAMNIANKDPLTGVQSRTAYNNMETVLNAQISAGTSETFGVIVCDCNNLKEINDNFGHAAGDRLIIDMSKTICDIFLHSPVYRIGGDEFAILLQGLDYENREALTKKLDMYRDERYAGYSFAWGMSEFNKEDDIDVHDVYKRADSKMYENKRTLKKLQEKR